jgi:hypothetical protein
LTVSYLGKLRDRVRQNATSVSGDGLLDGTFAVQIAAGSGARTVTKLKLRRSDDGGTWDTNPATIYWVLGAAAGLDSLLLNSGTDTVNFAVTEGQTFYVFAADPSASLFVTGATFELTMRLADGSTATVSATINQ